MTLQVRTHTNSVSDINMDSEKVEGLCFPLLFPHGEPGYTNASKSGMSPDEYAMSTLMQYFTLHAFNRITAKSCYGGEKHLNPVGFYSRNSTKSTVDPQHN